MKVSAREKKKERKGVKVRVKEVRGRGVKRVSRKGDRGRGKKRELTLFSAGLR